MIEAKISGWAVYTDEWFYYARNLISADRKKDILPNETGGEF